MNTSIYKDHYKVIAPLIMCAGVGDGITTSCVMAQAATIDALRKGLTLDRPTDKMECACPVLRRMAIRLNDGNWWASDIERTEMLRPLIPMLLDSRGKRELTQRRIYSVTDHAVRVITPMRLAWIARSRSKQADKIAGWIKVISEAEPITSKESALATRDKCRGIRADAFEGGVAAVADAADAADAAAFADDDAGADDAAADASAAFASAASAAAAQRFKYRDYLLECFRNCDALK